MRNGLSVKATIGTYAELRARTLDLCRRCEDARRRSARLARSSRGHAGAWRWLTAPALPGDGVARKHDYAWDDAMARGRQPGPLLACPDISLCVQASSCMDDVLQTVARTLADELAQPLTVLLGTVKLWRGESPSPERLPEVLAVLEEATDEIARRFARLARASHYATRTKAGFVVLDLDHAD